MPQISEIITDKELEWIGRYIENPAPTGNERMGQRMWLDYIAPYVDEHITDIYGNVAAIVNPGKDFRVVIEAHADEIAWYVHTITNDGYIRVESTGGTDPGISPSQRVNIHTKDGMVQGIFGWPAIHVRPMPEATPDKSNIFIDVGCFSRDEVEGLGIQVGDLITYECQFKVLNKEFYVGRALDNRMGGFAIARVAQLLKQENIELPYTLYIVNAVQEEVGTKGAQMMVETIKPQCAIVVDVTHATRTPGLSTDKEGDIELGKGVVITKSPPIHNKPRSLLQEVAVDHKIPVQLAAVSKETGTDADAFAYAGGGIPTALLSFPLRYMHTTVETTHRTDVESTIRLLYHSQQKITPEFDFHYFK
ncbi:MAG: M42 family peptidase [Sphingobacteriales bacterium]|nr:MAG: M42 family peptidase [Sphingobacteriales bacterium]